MANSDYSIRGSAGVFASVVNVASPIGPLDTNIAVTNWKRVGGDVRRVGEGLMIGKEICMLTGFSDTQLTIARGCADTIPQGHAAGTPIWFYEDAVGLESTPNERAAGTTIGVKVLPMTVGGGQLALTNSPPNGLTFNQRFARPYPPGNVKMNGAPWFQNAFLSATSTTLGITWAHRDRKLQANLLIFHGEGNIGPEPGTTYTIKVYKSNGSASLNDWPLVRTVAGITGTTFNYTYSMALDDFGPNFFDSGYMRLTSVRDGLDSWQDYIIQFAVSTGDAEDAGWGFDWGNNWGGNP